MKSRILVVDDDQSILELLRFLLEGEGYRVLAFDSASTALRAATAHSPDAAIVDLMMPGMNGLELIQALRYDPRTQHVPVLICSAYYGDLRHITTNLKLKRVYSLRKPFQIQELLDRLARLVAESRQERLEASKSNADTTTVETPAVMAEPTQVPSVHPTTLVPISTLEQGRRGLAQPHQNGDPIDSGGIAPMQARARRR